MDLERLMDRLGGAPGRADSLMHLEIVAPRAGREATWPHWLDAPVRGAFERVGGNETILLNAFTLDGQSKQTMAEAGVFDFKVGATLRPSAGQADGLYTGTFDVTIQYP